VPTYGYRCPSCSLEFEVWQRMTAEPVAACPNCGTVAKRLFFPAGIVFKGSGFYKTDNRSSSSGGDGSAAAASKPSSAKKDSSKNDSTKTSSTDTASSSSSSATAS